MNSETLKEGDILKTIKEINTISFEELNNPDLLKHRNLID